MIHNHSADRNVLYFRDTIFEAEWNGYLYLFVGYTSFSMNSITPLCRHVSIAKDQPMFAEFAGRFRGQ